MKAKQSLIAWFKRDRNLVRTNEGSIKSVKLTKGRVYFPNLNQKTIHADIKANCDEQVDSAEIKVS